MGPKSYTKQWSAMMEDEAGNSQRRPTIDRYVSEFSSPEDEGKNVKKAESGYIKYTSMSPYG